MYVYVFVFLILSSRSRRNYDDSFGMRVKWWKQMQGTKVTQHLFAINRMTRMIRKRRKEKENSELRARQETVNRRFKSNGESYNKDSGNNTKNHQMLFYVECLWPSMLFRCVVFRYSRGRSLLFSVCSCCCSCCWCSTTTAAAKFICACWSCSMYHCGFNTGAIVGTRIRCRP